MSTSEERLPSAQRLLTLRIIHIALLVGCLTFGVIAVVVGEQAQPAVLPDPPLLSHVGIVFAGLVGLAYLLVPAMMLNSWRHRLARGEANAVPAGDDADSPYWDFLQTHFIVGAALLESVVFFQLLVYLSEKQPWSLGVAAFFWLLLLLKFPTEMGTRRWIETQRDRVALLRNSGM